MHSLSQLIVQCLRRMHRDRDDRGASLVEYALLVALIALVCFAAVGFLGGSTSRSFSEYGSSLTAAQN